VLHSQKENVARLNFEGLFTLPSNEIVLASIHRDANISIPLVVGYPKAGPEIFSSLYKGVDQLGPTQLETSSSLQGRSAQVARRQQQNVVECCEHSRLALG